MKRIAIGVPLVGEFRGRTREAGKFDRPDDGVSVAYDAKYRFECDVDGTLADLEFTVVQIEDAANFDGRSLSKGDYVTIQGVAGSGDRGLYVKPTRIVRCDAAGKETPLKVAQAS